MRNTTREDLLKAVARGAEVVETRSHQPVKYRPRKDGDRRPWAVYDPGARQTYHLADSEVSVIEGALVPVPVSAFEEAQAKARAAAAAMVSLLAVTLHAQFPDARFLVITRYETDYAGNCLRLDSVRDAAGRNVWEFPEQPGTQEQLPAVPEEIAALWGSHDPRDPEVILDLAQQIEDTEPYSCFAFLPKEFLTDREIKAESSGGRTPLGVPLAASRRP